MSPEEKGALLLAHYEGKVIQIAWIASCSGEKVWLDQPSPAWDNFCAYRVKPPAEKVVIFTSITDSPWGCTADTSPKGRTHKITFDTIDGEPDCTSIKMEKL